MEKSKSYKWAIAQAFDPHIEWLYGYHLFNDHPEPTPIESLFYASVMLYLGSWGFLDDWKITPQLTVNTHRVDFSFKHENGGEFFIDLDGHDFHERTREQAKRDRSIDRKFALNGQTLLRYTGSEVWSEMEKICEELTSLILDLETHSQKRLADISNV